MRVDGQAVSCSLRGRRAGRFCCCFHVVSSLEETEFKDCSHLGRDGEKGGDGGCPDRDPKDDVELEL